MHEESFVKAIQYLEFGYVIQSSLSDIRIKKINNNYYYCFEVHPNNYSEWKFCDDNQELFRIGEIKNAWYISKDD
ncbi:hypothetical protein IAI10_16430 [Clostridium sp. 19966]|uniref:hypothetical protein n=1 Tax=Clostridium sp. 19966 TaxID=2768166 RepID=UPI0028DF2C7A|nr:hypothetical protein [Clostridium sp. 19966]MDT8718255.1 hypothetical protein [Clostridium sp. 19966]